MIMGLIAEIADIIALLKPQFEAGKGRVNRKGVVTDSKVHIEVLNDLAVFCQRENLSLLALTFSPLKGPSGNIEFLMHLRKDNIGIRTLPMDEIESLVVHAHTQLK